MNKDAGSQALSDMLVNKRSSAKLFAKEIPGVGRDRFVFFCFFCILCYVIHC